MEFITRSSPLHDQLERARKAGFVELAEAFGLAAKVKPRVPIGGFDLGTCYANKADRLNPAEILRKFAHREKEWRKDAGEITDEMRWMPHVHPQCVQNVIALETGFGVIRDELFFAGDPVPKQTGFVVQIQNNAFMPRKRDLRVRIACFCSPGMPRSTFLYTENAP